jgi:ParB-like chromosome segregation protein Spo0J
VPRAADKAAKSTASKRVKKPPREQPLEGADNVPIPGAEWQIDNPTELVAVEALTPHPDNPNTGDVDAIEESMGEVGWYGVITAQRSTGRILAGEHRWKAAKARGASMVPVYWKDVDDIGALRIMIGDNEIARRGIIDRDRVSRLLTVIGDIRGTGITDEMLAEVAAADQDQTRKERVTKGPGNTEKLYDPGDDVYEQQWGVIVMCADEAEQQAVYDKAMKLKWKARAISV